MSPHDATRPLAGLKGALRYVRAYRDHVFVVKVGGEVVADAHGLDQVAAQIGLLSSLSIRIVVVHGGGPQATALSRRLGQEPEIVAGRRVTDDAALEVAKMVFSGTVNLELLCALRRHGVQPVGMSGVDADRMERAARRDLRGDLGLPPGTPLVGDVAAFGWHKAQEVLVEAWPLLLREVPDAHLALIGDGECRPAVEDLARRLGLLGTRVHFLGFRDDVPEVMGSLDLFAMPSVLEGLCTSALDAQAAGVPVVASAVGGLVEAVADGETGLLVPPRDPPALAAAMARILRDRDLGRRFSEAGRVRVRERFSVKAMVGGSRAVYGRMLRGEPVAPVPGDPGPGAPPGGAA
ncbi:MAG: glycosyltransferase family 4 protein [Planctomycetaceae bacterium]|nr:glycosyltransferase family 4 protein [Planctomycetaceae bacterium]